MDVHTVPIRPRPKGFLGLSVKSSLSLVGSGEETLAVKEGRRPCLLSLLVSAEEVHVRSAFFQATAMVCSVGAESKGIANIYTIKNKLNEHYRVTSVRWLKPGH